MSASDNLQETLNKIDAVIAEKQIAIKRGEMLTRLMNNPDFKELFIEGYIEEEATKLFNVLTNPGVTSEYTDAEIHFKLGYINHFKGYVGTEGYPGTVRMEADQAPGAIQVEREYRTKVTAENADIEAEG